MEKKKKKKGLRIKRMSSFLRLYCPFCLCSLTHFLVSFGSPLLGIMVADRIIISFLPSPHPQKICLGEGFYLRVASLLHFDILCCGQQKFKWKNTKLKKAHLIPKATVACNLGVNYEAKIHCIILKNNTALSQSMHTMMSAGYSNIDFYS